MTTPPKSKTPLTDAETARLGFKDADGKPLVHADFARSLELKLNEALAQLAEATRLHNELIMGVARKFEGESRHQTALRYIM